MLLLIVLSIFSSVLSDDSCVLAFSIDNKKHCLLSATALNTLADSHELDLTIKINQHVLKICQSNFRSCTASIANEMTQSINEVIAEFKNNKDTNNVDNNNDNVDDNNIVTYRIMQKLGIKSDKIYRHGYHLIYPSLFNQHSISRTSTFKMLEIGYGKGYSVHLWQSLFPNAEITWIDYNHEYDNKRKHCVPNDKEIGCYVGSKNRSRFYHGDQSNRTFLMSVVQDQCNSLEQPCFDVIIDDGGHGYVQQLTSFQTLFPLALKPGGLYVIEDIETSYWTHGDAFGDPTNGGHQASHTPVGVWRKLVNVLNKKFFNRNYQADKSIGTKVEALIKSISFAKNMLIASRKEIEVRIFDELIHQRNYSFRHHVEDYQDLNDNNDEDEDVDYYEENKKLKIEIRMLRKKLYLQYSLDEYHSLSPYSITED